MGFALWIDGDVARAEGTHEYRPMGAAAIGTGTQFTARDFRPLIRAAQRNTATFAGLFASLGDMNHYLKQRQARRVPRRRARSAALL